VTRFVALRTWVFSRRAHAVVLPDSRPATASAGR
jgi:hypothetical protein